ncbi:penicillin-binding protein, transpeptidase domain protein [Aerococcus viridans ATCC 11563 = CCUG 4311]|uniref:Penicillin-binding protein, transpeptidase domain protein n=1 Tax=Aerococcus viridans (strain ATCC 11563 / DSM 20340 / CCUG 4311 / JCM 20461 / NBRC 12219 / NCTC 8251 / M1) TaxID=655812 RepID=A0ABN0AA07_AERVM|nr:penicillin-binding protein, transpeptidase domain protein [Aerococcus viridans ATCC 11563 = CCUG 4311]
MKVGDKLDQGNQNKQPKQHEGAEEKLNKMGSDDQDQPKRRAPIWGSFLNRLNVMLIGIFVLFAILILRLSYLQLVQGDMFSDLVNATETTIVEESVPRGLIVDSEGELMVSNEALPAISYTRGQDTSGEDMARTAQNLAKYIAIDFEDVSDRDLQDYFVAANTDVINDRLTDDEAAAADDEIYAIQVSKVTDDDLNGLSDQDKEAAVIFAKMNAASSLSTVMIKNDGVTTEEMAVVAERSAELPGVNVTTDWKRTYPQDSLLRSLLGSVSSTEEGIPSDQRDFYLAKGYALNDRVGVSYIEEQYEADLRGSKTTYETEVSQDGEIINSEQTYAGEMGNTVQLTIDSEYQAELEAYATQYLEDATTEDNNSIYIVASDPDTGAIYALVGKKKNSDGEIVDDALGTINSVFVSGSVVKPATIAAGYGEGLLEVGSDNEITDEPLYFSGTPVKASWWFTSDNDSTPRILTDKQASAQSSNVYMIKLAMAMGGVNYYEPYMDLSELDTDAVYDTLRDYYAEFGLGVSTGIDLENESTGLIGADTGDPGNALDLSFGQFDTYSPIQLNQYISTIANGGTRYALHVLDKILAPTEDEETAGDGATVYEYQPTVLNELSITDEMLAEVQEGIWSVIHTSTGLGNAIFANFPIEVAGKSGTATVSDTLENSTWAGWAPYDDPEIAVSIVIPGTTPDVSVSAQAAAPNVLGLYYDIEEYQNKVADQLAENAEASAEEAEALEEAQ